MTTINKAFINECFKFLSKAGNYAINNKVTQVKGAVPNGPQYRVTTEMNKHTKIGKCHIDLKCGEEYYPVFMTQYRLGDSVLRLSLLEQAEFEQYTGYGIYNIVNHETGFSETLENMLTGATHLASVDHFSGISVKFHSEDDSQRFMVCRGKDVYYALEEAVFLQDGFSAISMTSTKDLKAKVMSVLKDYLETFNLEGFEHTFNQPE